MQNLLLLMNVNAAEVYCRVRIAASVAAAAAQGRAAPAAAYARPRWLPRLAASRCLQWRSAALLRPRLLFPLLLPGRVLPISRLHHGMLLLLPLLLPLQQLPFLLPARPWRRLWAPTLARRRHCGKEARDGGRGCCLFKAAGHKPQLHNCGGGRVAGCCLRLERTWEGMEAKGVGR